MHSPESEKCPIVDTWWQTETGGILISPLPGATDLKPGSATLPLFGVRPAIVDGTGAAAFTADGTPSATRVARRRWRAPDRRCSRAAG